MVTLTRRKLADSDSSSAPPTGDSRAATLAQLATLGDAQSHELAQLFKLLADETRLRILYYLMQQDELNVGTFCKLLRESQPAVSHHLALLKEAGIIDYRRDGKHNFYRFVPKRCQAYLDTLFGGTADVPRKVRVDDAVLTYAREGAR